MSEVRRERSGGVKTWRKNIMSVYNSFKKNWNWRQKRMVVIIREQVLLSPRLNGQYIYNC